MKILSKKTIVDYSGTRIIQLTLSAPQISQKALPGQFVVLMIGEKGERIPLTIVQSDVESRSIKVIFQETGFTTKALGALDTGDSLYALVGPLGHATEIKKYGKVILVGGGWEWLRFIRWPEG
jgi:ferredoxin--NADP+ reductase